MIEIEMKFPVDDWQELQTALQHLSAETGDSYQQEDHYYNAPDRDFASTDEAVRIRRTEDKNVLTYKGPKLDDTTKSRKEVEVTIESGQAAFERLDQFFLCLQYRPVAVMRKQRQQCRLRYQQFDVEVCLDRVDEVGDFVELEIMAPEQQYDAACNAIQELAKELGLKQSQRLSYLELWLAEHQKI